MRLMAAEPIKEEQTMGMDVIGTNPRNQTGKYFRNNIWWWHPLWEYCSEVAPDICGRVVYGHSNDGDGLDAEASTALAQLLRNEIESGRTATYAATRESALKKLPDVVCQI